MPRVSVKKAAKPRKGKLDGASASPNGNGSAEEESGMAAAVSAKPMELRPPTRPVEAPGAPAAPKTPPAAVLRDATATSLNIAKLQAMSMTELNHMAKDLGVENFGTMRKHEVIFHILQKNAERSGVLFSEGVLEVLSWKGSGSCGRAFSPDGKTLASGSETARRFCGTSRPVAAFYPQ